MDEKSKALALIHHRLLQTARVENDPHLLQLLSIHDALAAQVEVLAQKINEMQAPATEFRQDIKDKVKSEIDAGRTVDYALVTVKRVKKWVYDRDEAASWAEEFEPQAVKITLKVREFEKLLPLQMDDTVRFGIEQVERIDIALPKDLSHLLMVDED